MQPAPAAADELDKARITGGMIKRIRKRLGISQADLAKLLGVSGQSVYQWEKKTGRLTLRGNTKSAIVDVRKLGKRDAKRRLEEPAAAPKKPRRKKESRKKTPARPRRKTRR